MTDQTYQIYVGDAELVAPTLDGLYDAVVCDPPYGLSFMGRGWDRSVPGPDLWRAIASKLRPGAHVFAFGGTRLWHHLALSLEDAGFEIRDTVMWLYGSGFPKSHNLDGAHEGYGTALKPAWEPCIVARWPVVGTVAQNAAEHGTGALNIDGARIATDEQWDAGVRSGAKGCTFGGDLNKYASASHDLGRWPANVVLDEEAGAALDAQAGDGEPSRFFYCAKASRAEREAGLDDRTPRIVSDGRQASHDTAHMRADTLRRNVHPTVKPIDLTRWLATLALPPDVGRPRRVLVPFSGSGSEMIGCLQAGWEEVVGIELNPEYADIARARLAHHVEQMRRERAQLALF